MKVTKAISLALASLWLLALAPAPARTGPAAADDAASLAALLSTPLFREADRLAAKLLADPALEAPALALCGLAVLRAGRIGEAETIFHRAVALAPDCPEAHLGLGRIARIRNDEDAAVAHLRRAVPSVPFFEDACRHLWRAAWTRGEVAELEAIRALVEGRFRERSLPLHTSIENGAALLRGLSGRKLFAMEGSFEKITVPLLGGENGRSRIRMIPLRLNGGAEYPVDIDSASADFLTISPLLAEELKLVPVGYSTATGVGTSAPQVRFAVLDKVELGPVAFRNVPVMVSDLHTFRGLKKGLLGTALLKRFNVTIDAAAQAMVLYPLDRPERLAAAIARDAVAADVPLYCYDATTVEAVLDGALPALYILDTAAATNLVDKRFFEDHIKPKLDPARIVRGGIQGAGGPQSVNRVEGLPVRLGPLLYPSQQFNEFSMETLNMIPGRYTAGLLGNPLLWPYRVHMDFRNGRLILEK
jgi:hypothetical protein